MLKFLWNKAGRGSLRLVASFLVGLGDAEATILECEHFAPPKMKRKIYYYDIKYKNNVNKSYPQA